MQCWKENTGTCIVSTNSQRVSLCSKSFLFFRDSESNVYEKPDLVVGLLHSMNFFYWIPKVKNKSV